MRWSERWLDRVGMFVYWPFAVAQGKSATARALLVVVAFVWVMPAMAVAGIPILFLLFAEMFQSLGEPED